MRLSTPCGAVSKALQASKEKMWMGYPRWSCRCAMNRGGPGVGGGEGPLLPVTDHPLSCEHLRDPLREGTCEQLHVQLAQGYGPVVVQHSGVWDLRAEPDVGMSPMGRRWGAGQDGPIEVDYQPLDCRWEGLGQAGLHMVRARGLGVSLVLRGLQVLDAVLLNLGPLPLRDLGHVVTEDSLEAREILLALAVQLLQDGADRSHHVLLLRQEGLGVWIPPVP